VAGGEVTDSRHDWPETRAFTGVADPR